MSKCCKVIDLQANEDYYMVESSDGTEDYETRYDPEKGFTCTCEAGKHGFANCKNYCWHVRASVACFLEEEAYEQKRTERVSTHNAALPIVTESTHPQELVAVKVSTVEANLPAFLRDKRPAPHMSKAPRER